MKSGIFLLLGSNQGDSRGNLSRAREALQTLIGPIVTTSSLYRTAAWGKTNQPDFYNQVIQIDTALEPHTLLDKILNIEQRLGRIRKEKWGPRIIDIDILFYHDKINNTTDLILPHPGIPIRRFTLVPLDEIAPELYHPVLKKQIRTLLKECSDLSEVEKVIN
jgi:2-amino-4-hydroxy-6-hydroxymethyldihydropteridine diphosphokinase